MEGIRSKIDFSGIGRNQWIFSAILIVMSLISWYLVYSVFYESYKGFNAWLFLALFIFLLSTGVGLSFFLLRPRRLAILTYIAIGLTSFLFFGWRGYEILGVIAFVGTTIFGYLWVKREEQMLIKFLHVRLIRRGMPIFFTGIAIALAIFYNASPSGNVFERPQLPEPFFDSVLVPIEYLTRQAIPDFDRNMKIGEVEELSVREAPKFVNASPLVVTSFVRELFSKIPKDKQDKTLVEFLHGAINLQLDAILLPYREFLPVVFIFGLFLVMKAIGIPLMWLAIGTGWITVKILFMLNVVHIRKIEAKKEELML